MDGNVLQYVRNKADKIRGFVLEVGSLDVNGNLNEFLPPGSIRTDMRAGRNVDVICAAENLRELYEPQTFDTVICVDMLEHCEHWREAVNAMWDVLKIDGWLIMAMAARGKGFHGYPSDYWRTDPETIDEIFPGAQCRDIGISIAWCSQKNGPLPDLSTFEFSPVHKWRGADRPLSGPVKYTEPTDNWWSNRKAAHAAVKEARHRGRK